MPMYTFHFCDPQGGSASFEVFELTHDPAAFDKAGALLEDHQSCDHIDVYNGERPVVSRHRYQPIIRPVFEPPERQSA